MRVQDHPILGKAELRKKVTMMVDGRPVEALEGEPIATALLAAGRRVFRHTAKDNKPRGIFCALGRCTDCVMIVDGQPNVRACVTRVEAGQKIELQDGFGWIDMNIPGPKAGRLIQKQTELAIIGAGPAGYVVIRSSHDHSQPRLRGGLRSVPRQLRELRHESRHLG